MALTHSPEYFSWGAPGHGGSIRLPFAPSNAVNGRIGGESAAGRSGSKLRPWPEGLESRALLSITEYPIPNYQFRDNASQLTPGPDGNVWFTFAGDNFIDQITPDGTITQFPMPVGGGFTPWGITTLPNETLAATVKVPGGSSISTITTSGQISTLAIPQSILNVNQGAGDLAAGPIGSL